MLALLLAWIVWAVSPSREPVALALEATIFTDGFEGSGLCAWSGAEPLLPLLITEVAVAPTAGEFVEILNPHPGVAALENVYLADHPEYYLVTEAAKPGSSSDFSARFPDGATISCGEHQVVSLHAATDFETSYGFPPHFDFDSSDSGATAMEGDYGSVSGLTNGDEMVVLFLWDGIAAIVADLDYVVYGDTSDAADRTGVLGYQPDTPAELQDAAEAPAEPLSLQRCDGAETTETRTGGNGITGHDETSEALGTAFIVAPPTPGQASVCNP